MQPRRLSLAILLLASCARVGGDDGTELEPRGSCELPRNHTPPTCGQVTVVDRDIEIGSCEDFDYADLPDTCWKLTGTLAITGPGVTSVARLDGLQQVGGLILENTGLVTFDSGGDVKVKSGIVVRDNEELADLSALVIDDELDGFIIENNAALESLGSLANVATVTGKAIVTKNRRLAKVEFAARTIGSLAITDNATLAELAMPNLDSIGEGTGVLRFGDVAIERVPMLTAFRMPRLRTVAGSLSIIDTGLVTLEDFGESLVVDWDVSVTNNASLTNVGKIARAKSIDGTIAISDNAQLACKAAREVGCCVASDAFVIGGNATETCTSGGEAWCKAQNFFFQCHH